jgi:tyrosyl-tRNA synthetase
MRPPTCDNSGQDQPKATALLDFETPGRLEVRYNSEWLEGMDLPAVIGLLGTGTVGQMLAKEDFSNRYSSGTPIALHEFLYPLLQGYDSVAVNADVELGGTDQKFNVAMGRDLQRHFGRGTQFGLLLPILVGLDGTQKMSKTLGNTVGLEDDPLSMYSKLEKVGDTGDQRLRDVAHRPQCRGVAGEPTREAEGDGTGGDRNAPWQGCGRKSPARCWKPGGRCRRCISRCA